MDGMLLTAAGVGFVMGVRHALDPDHVVAVSAIVSEQGSLRRSSLVGTFWGLGHALSLLAAGGALLALKLSVPARAAIWLEGAVGAMLVLLGVSTLRAALHGWRLHAHRHAHDGREHVHLHAHRPGAEAAHHHAHPLGFGLRPFMVGVVHGLAGSAGAALLALGAAPSARAGLAYMGMLGLGSVAGMVGLSSLLSLPLALLSKRYTRLHLRFQLLAGACSLALGLWLFGHHALEIPSLQQGLDSGFLIGERQ